MQHLQENNPTDYGDPQNEVLALTASTVLVDRSNVGRLSLKGSDSLELINRLSTNKLEEIPIGEGMPTVLTTPKGRVVDFLLLGSQPDQLICLTSPGQQQKILDWIDFYTFGEDVQMEDISEITSHFTICGPNSESAVFNLGFIAHRIAPYQLQTVDFDGFSMIVWRTMSSGADSFEFIVSRESGSRLWSFLKNSGLMPVGSAAWDTLRISNGAPVYAAEYGDHTNPLESRLGGAINFSKGCYIGQEVVARLDTYKKVQRYLMLVKLPCSAKVGDKLEAEGQTIGLLTSVAVYPIEEQYWALGFIDARFAVAGRNVGLVGYSAMATLYDPPYAIATESTFIN
jgi:folate-binding protein YgfZ